MRICLSSLSRYLAPASVGRLLVVIPDRVPKASVRARTWNDDPMPFATEVVHDAELLGEGCWRDSLSPWLTQQAVKIAAADRLRSDFYVTLDSDVLLVKPTVYDDLVVDGRAATLLHTRNVHAAWWSASAELLGTDPRLDQDGMGVTPAILSRDIARALMRYLESRREGPWYRSIVEYVADLKAKRRWNPVPWTIFPAPTEYTLYYLFAEASGRAEQYHARSESLWCAQQIYSHDELARLPAHLHAARTSQGRFLVLQSSLGLTPEQVWSHVAPALELGVASS